MAYIVLEIQKNNGTVSVVPPIAYNTMEEAKSKYFTILASASISAVEKHSACILNENGKTIENYSFEHSV